MPHKPPDPPLGVGKVLLALWILANVASPVAAQQQQQHQNKQPEHRLSRSHGLSEPLPQGKSTWVEPVNPSHFVEDQDDGQLHDGSNRISKSNKKDRDAAQRVQKERRADLAPYAPDVRSSGDAVRAPAKKPFLRRSSDGLYSRLPARSLQDWKIEDIVLLATVDGGIHAADRDTGKTLWAWPGDRPMVETVHHKTNKSKDGTDASSDPLVNDFIWIVEPSQDGALYGYTPGASRGMQNLDLTVKDIVNELSPFESGTPRVVYNGDKRSELYTIDIATGDVIRGFTATGSFKGNHGVCREKGGLDALDDDKCGPIGALTVTRTDYTIGIQSYEGDMICTIKYSEWGPNIRDNDLRIQYMAAKGDRYIHSMVNGEIYAIDHKNLDPATMEREREIKPTYRQKYSSPVVRVFDIARPLRSTSFDTPLVLLQQPEDPIFSLSENYRVLVGSTDTGSLYALSQAKYPLASGSADRAKCVGSDLPKNDLHQNLAEYLVGVHPLGSRDYSRTDLPGISGVTPPPALDAPVNDTPNVGHDTSVVDEKVPPRVSGLNYTQIILAFLVISLTGFGAGRLLPTTSLFGKSRQVSGPAFVPVAATPTVETPPTVDFSAPVENEPAATEAIDKGITEKSVKFHEDVEKEDFAKEDAGKENEPPGGDAVMVHEEDAAPADEEAAKPVKKKAHRGKRGGKKEAEKRALKANIQQEEIEGIVEGVKQTNQNLSVTPDIVYQKVTEEKDAPAGLLNLHIDTNNILGHGSGGTLVFEGKFEGRDVAVKRMLGQYSELASQEVSLLEQSEDHPNVIRYFCRRQDEHFLYIALELCQASLWEIYRDGRRDEVAEKYHALVDEINSEPQRVLRQLAEGLKHLHTFRIVHRDIKPQNMLIAYPKKHMASTFPRIVISDFGLCKTLPEGASTLIGATVSAGTIGWKAPELITQPKENAGMSASSTGGGSANGDFAGAMGIKRSTDIFSLGCVFFYILTRGQHPFDDEEGWMGIRERNIKSDKCNLEAISLHGPDTVDLIRWMLMPRPEDRPTAAEVLAHPFFWNAEDRLEFLSLTSDRFDMEARDGTSVALAELESYAEDIIGAGPATLSLTSASASSRFNSSSANHHRSSSSHSESTSTAMNMPMPGEPNFLAALDKKFIDTLGKQRKYQGHKVVDLLRALRNKHHHWDDMPDDVKQRVGAVPEGYLRYWEQRFPKLTVRMWRVVKELDFGSERRFWRWFGSRTDSM